MYASLNRDSSTGAWLPDRMWIIEACENAAREAGFTRFEMGATLSGEAFYQAKGYARLENLEVPLDNGKSLAIVRMAKFTA